MYIFCYSFQSIVNLRLKFWGYNEKNNGLSFVTQKSANSPVSQYERPRAVALASSACVDKTTKIITEFTRKDPFLHLKRAN